MNNVLRKLETDEVVIYTNHTYSAATLEKCRRIHAELVIGGKLEGDFDSDLWIGHSGVRRFGMNFTINPEAYKKHVGREFGISYNTMKNMLRCYAIYCNGVYIYQTISSEKLNVIKTFLEGFPGKGLKLTVTNIVAIEDFLAFIATPENQISDILSRIARKKESSAGQRQLSPIINYLVIENEINTLFRNNPDETEFRKWFPI